MAKKKKKDSSAASTKSEEVIETTVETADPNELEPFMQKLVNAVANLPAPDADTAESEPQTKEQPEIPDEAAVVSSITHSTVILEESVPQSPADTDTTESPKDHESADPSAENTDLTEDEKAQQRCDNAEFSMIDEAADNPFRNVFVESLANVTADDLGAPPKKKKKDPVDVIIDLFRKAIFWAAVVAFFVSGYQIVTKLYAYRQSEKIYNFDEIFNTDRREDLVAVAAHSDRLSAIAPINCTIEESEALKNEAQNNQFNEKLLILQGQLQILRNNYNKEVVGWIEMPGKTEINYPVVQGQDNDYYLHYAYNGAYNPAGSIYLDYRNNVTVSSNRHTIIYGHNMESGSPMFANLLHFKDESYWKNNRYINIYTDEALYTYEVFAAYETSPQQAGVENHSWRMNFNKDDKVFLAWVDSVRSRSDISPNVSVDATSRILTLSTCMNVNENRYVVHAVLVEVVK